MGWRWFSRRVWIDTAEMLPGAGAVLRASLVNPVRICIGVTLASSFSTLYGTLYKKRINMLTRNCESKTSPLADTLLLFGVP